MHKRHMEPLGPTYFYFRKNGKIKPQTQPNSYETKISPFDYDSSIPPIVWVDQ
jgi:hypothetical protein